MHERVFVEILHNWLALKRIKNLWKDVGLCAVCRVQKSDQLNKVDRQSKRGWGVSSCRCWGRFADFVPCVRVLSAVISSLVSSSSSPEPPFNIDIIVHNPYYRHHIYRTLSLRRGSVRFPPLPPPPRRRRLLVLTAAATASKLPSPGFKYRTLSASV